MLVQELDQMPRTLIIKRLKVDILEPDPDLANEIKRTSVTNKIMLVRRLLTAPYMISMKPVFRKIIY